MGSIPLQVGNKSPLCEGNQAYLPIASSMMLIWLSEGDRILGGLSVRGAVERQRQNVNSGSLFFPFELAALKMNGIGKYSE